MESTPTEPICLQEIETPAWSVTSGKKAASPVPTSSYHKWSLQDKPGLQDKSKPLPLKRRPVHSFP